MSMFSQDAPSVFNPLQMPTPQMPQPKPQGGMFGGKGRGIAELLLAGLNGYLAARGNPVGIANLQQMHDAKMLKQRQALEEQTYQRQRQDGMADWMAKEQFKLAHPDPSNPHYFESNSGDQYSIGPDGQPQLVFKDPLRYKLVPNGMGGVVPVNIESLMNGSGPPPGVTFTPIDGGPTPQASGGFPRPY